MIIKALIAAGIVVAATSAQALTVYPTFVNQIAHPGVTPFTTPPSPSPDRTPVPAPSAVPSVPEPAAWMMLIVGFGAVGLIRRARVRTLTA